MPYRKTFLTCLAVLLSASLAFAAEQEEGEKKPPKDEKPRPDSAISGVLELPMVKEWGRWMGTKKPPTNMVAWGESVNEVEGHKCWGIAVGESAQNGVHVWRRFCASETGSNVWVESIPADPLDEIHYMPYDDWLKKCKPTYNSAGEC